MNRVPVKSTEELIAYAKANPGKLAVANSGVGGANHITAVVMAKHLGIQWKTCALQGRRGCDPRRRVAARAA